MGVRTHRMRHCARRMCPGLLDSSHLTLTVLRAASSHLSYSVPRAMTKYCPCVVPAFLMPCSSFEAT